MPVIAEGWLFDQLRVSAGAGKRVMEALHELSRKQLIVLAVDPEHRHPRAFAEVGKGRDQTILGALASFAGVDRDLSARKIDSREQPARRIGRQRDRGKAAGRLADGKQT